MTLLALDLGTTTGFCVGNSEHSVSGVWQLKGDRFSGAGMRYVRFRGHLNEVHNAYKIDYVVFEAVRRHLGTDAAHAYGAILGTLMAWCEDNKLPYEGLAVGAIKKFATGRGNADKRAMVAYARSVGVETHDDNEADAVALFQLMLAREARDPATVLMDLGIIG